MGFHILANFPANRDYKGILKVYNDSGTLVFGPVEALGRGSNDEANGGDHTNWKRKNADIPTGVAKCKVYAKGSSEYSYGPYKRVWLNEAVSGNFLIAAQNGRDEIMIHGGDPAPSSSATWYPLRPTYGCIRLSNSNQKALIQILEANGSSGKITISEV
ncbi:L,D-transpeptidase [Paenibacillus sp. FSL R10-2782]|uniref:L,D-transpeptidase n=1 Tax=Paenibacillus terrae TaxID=159743 RepID=A0A4U2PYR0_9BACL|nr:L,D-transpeptidase [Paenibacillus terrae]TKH43879.1 L,D-transpeptidase [Paenibacillus terrae]